VRILILSQYYFPEPVEKVHDLARGLVALGHSVQVLTGVPCYPLGRVYEGYRQRAWQREEIDGVHVLRVPQIPDHSHSAIKRAIYYGSFAVSATAFGPAHLEPADVMLVYQAALPVGFAAWAIGRLRRLPIVLDVVDLWPESVLASGISKSARLARVVRRAAKWVYSKADHISVITEGYRDNLIDMGVPAGKLGVIYPWMPTQTYGPRPPDPELAAREGLTGRFNIVYAGNIGPIQALDVVLDAAETLRDLPAVQFVIVGSGAERERLIASARSRRLDNVRFLERRPPEDMPALYALADALLVHLRPDPMSRISIPSKLFAYLPSGRPILAGVEGEVQRLTEREGFGLAFEPSMPAALAAAVRRLYGMSSAERAGLARAALSFHEREGNGPVLTRRFERVLMQVVQRRGAASSVMTPS
jgi:glycosyltransferase involved in cell wall biosynthesis